MHAEVVSVALFLAPVQGGHDAREVSRTRFHVDSSRTYGTQASMALACESVRPSAHRRTDRDSAPTVAPPNSDAALTVVWCVGLFDMCAYTASEHAHL